MGRRGRLHSIVALLPILPCHSHLTVAKIECVQMQRLGQCEAGIDVPVGVFVEIAFTCTPFRSVQAIVSKKARGVIVFFSRRKNAVPMSKTCRPYIHYFNARQLYITEAELCLCSPRVQAICSLISYHVAPGTGHSTSDSQANCRRAAFAKKGLLASLRTCTRPCDQ